MIIIRKFPTIKMRWISKGVYRAVLEVAYPDMAKKFDLDDTWYRMPAELGDWYMMIRSVQEYSFDILKKRRVARYYPEARDCDNWAGIIRQQCSLLYDCNGLVEVEGKAKMESGGKYIRHKWNTFYVPSTRKVWQLEPQTLLDIFPHDDYRYVPDEFILG